MVRRRGHNPTTSTMTSANNSATSNNTGSLFDTATPESLISILSERPWSHKIHDKRWAVPALDRVAPAFPPGSIGSLGKYPMDIIDSIVKNLDYLSAYRLSRSCRQASYIVTANAAYRDIMKHASNIPRLLVLTGLVDYHSIASVHAAFRTQKCVSCGTFGAYLYLPLCQRVCLFCMSKNPAFRMVPLPLAQAVFDVSREQLDAARIPIMRPSPRYTPVEWLRWWYHETWRYRPS